MNNRVKRAAKHCLVLCEQQDRPDLGKPANFCGLDWLGLETKKKLMASLGLAWLGFVLGLVFKLGLVFGLTWLFGLAFWLGLVGGFFEQNQTKKNGYIFDDSLLPVYWK